MPANAPGRPHSWFLRPSSGEIVGAVVVVFDRGPVIGQVSAHLAGR